MITLQQAIDLATKAHKGQWRKISPITVEEFEQITPSTRRSLLSETHLILDNSVNVFLPNKDMLGRNVWRRITVRRPYITHPLAVMDRIHTEEEYMMLLKKYRMGAISI